MKTLEQIKDEYVMDNFLASHELDRWIDFQNYFASRHPQWFEQHYDEVIKRYADECAKEALKNASKGFTPAKIVYNEKTRSYDKVASIKDILSEDNLPKH